MKALSIRQPWASLILGTCITGVPKDIENRTWRTHHRGPLLIHASSMNARMRTWDSRCAARYFLAKNF